MIAERKVVTKIEANPLLVSRERERTIIRVAAILSCVHGQRGAAR